MSEPATYKESMIERMMRRKNERITELEAELAAAKIVSELNRKLCAYDRAVSNLKQSIPLAHELGHTEQARALESVLVDLEAK